MKSTLNMAHIRIRVALHTGLSPYEVGPTGIRFNDPFLNKIYDYEEYFRSKVIIPINEMTGDNWHVYFTEYVFPYKGFFADIYADSAERAILIRNIISEKLGSEFAFMFYYKGTLEALISRYSTANA